MSPEFVSPEFDRYQIDDVWLTAVFYSAKSYFQGYIASIFDRLIAAKVFVCASLGSAGTCSPSTLRYSRILPVLTLIR